MNNYIQEYREAAQEIYRQTKLIEKLISSIRFSQQRSTRTISNEDDRIVYRKIKLLIEMNLNQNCERKKYSK